MNQLRTYEADSLLKDAEDRLPAGNYKEIIQSCKDATKLYLTELLQKHKEVEILKDKEFESLRKLYRYIINRFPDLRLAKHEIYFLDRFTTTMRYSGNTEVIVDKTLAFSSIKYAKRIRKTVYDILEKEIIKSREDYNVFANS